MKRQRGRSWRRNPYIYSRDVLMLEKKIRCFSQCQGEMARRDDEKVRRGIISRRLGYFFPITGYI